MSLSDPKIHEDAIRLYHQALRIILVNHEIWYNKAVVLMEMDHIPEAIATYNRVLELRSLDAEAIVNRTELLRTGTVSQRKSIEEAIANLKEATELYLEEFPAPHQSRILITTFEVASVAAQ